MNSEQFQDAMADFSARLADARIALVGLSNSLDSCEDGLKRLALDCNMVPASSSEMSKEDANTYDDENNYANREDADQSSRSGLHWTHS